MNHETPIRGCFFVVTLLFVWATGVPAWGHDLWLLPPPSTVVNQPVVVQAHSGMDFPKSEHAPDPAAFRRRRLLLPDGTEGQLEAAGREALSGLLRFTPGKQGVYIAAVETEAKLITLSAEEFNEYLVADGLPHIYRLRAKEKTLDRPARERYSKSPKVLMRIGAGRAGDPCRVLGLPLEIIPLRDPFQLREGEALHVRVLFQNRPLAGANLGWDLPADGEAASGTVRTNAAGEALVPIARTGLMTIRLTHMTRPNTKAYEWESFWTTLTFRIPE